MAVPETITITNLKIIALNMNSLISHTKRAELSILIEKTNPHIMLLSETKLNKKHKLSFRNYNLIRNDKEEGSVGTAILVKNNFDIEILTSKQTSSKLEYTAIKITGISVNKPLYVFSIYNNSQPNPNIESDITQLVNMVPNRSFPFVIGGDFNAKHTTWLNINNNTNGIKLRTWLDCNAHIVKSIHSAQPSYNAGSRHSYIDFFIVSKDLQSATSLLKSYEIQSDHSAIEMVLINDFNIKRRLPIKILNFKKVNWLYFHITARNELSKIVIPFNASLTINEIDKSIEDVNTAIRTTIEKSIPTLNIAAPESIVLPEGLKNTINLKNKLRRKLHRNPLHPNRQQLKSHINLLNIMIKNQMQTTLEENLQNKLKALKKDSNIFRKINKITQRKQFPSTPDFHDTNSNQIAPKIISNPIDKLHALGTHFELVHTSGINRGDLQFTNSVKQHVLEKFENDTCIATFTSELLSNGSSGGPTISGIKTFASLDEIKGIIKSMPPKKSSGYDKISNYIIKKLPAPFQVIITIIINNCINIGYFPSAWKCAKVLPFPKPGKCPYYPQNYRPISMLSCLSKVFENVMRSRIEEVTVQKRIIPFFQFAYQKLLSPTDAASTFSSDVCLALNNDEYLVACSLDVEKAFDTVWKEGLIYKCDVMYNFPTFLTKMIYNYLSNRTFRVIGYDSLGCEIISTEFNIAAGTPQGSIIAPILYNLYLSDMPSSINCRTPCQTIMFADDTMIYCSHTNVHIAAYNVNTHLKRLNKYYEKWKIKINYEKSEGIIFRRPATSKKKVPKVNITFNTTKIPIKTKIKYLGVNFTNLYKFSEHIKITLKKAQISISKLNTILSPYKNTHTDIKLLIYKQLVRPILSYAFPIWFNVSRQQIRAISILERKCLRKCINFKGPSLNDNKYISNSKLYDQTKITPIVEHLMNMSIKQLQNKIDHHNPLIKSMFDVNTTHCKRYRPPQFLVQANNEQMIYTAENNVKFYSVCNSRYPPI